jgi:hypothetical protein
MKLSGIILAIISVAVCAAYCVGAFTVICRTHNKYTPKVLKATDKYYVKIDGYWREVSTRTVTIMVKEQ